MQILGPSHVTGTSSIVRTEGTRVTEAVDSLHNFHGADQVEISTEAEQVSRTELQSDLRAERLAEIRQQILAGTYETNEKLEIAVGKMLDELVG
jgi:negative regulator of flagellin synthesis FlgM